MTETSKRCSIKEIDGQYKVTIDGKVVNGNTFRLPNRIKDLTTPVSIHANITSQLLELRPKDFGENISGIIVSIDKMDETPLIDGIRFSFRFNQNALVVTPSIDTMNWIYRISPADFIPGFFKILIKEMKKNIRVRVEWTNKTNIYIDIKDGELILYDYVSKILEALSISVLTASEAAGIYISEDRFEIAFDFPKHIRSACEQYLLYFVEFLKDNGETVTADITHNGTTTLFSILPESKDVALEKIFEALRLYLEAPGQFNSSQNYSMQSIEFQRLQIQIGHFQGQLALAQATMLQQRMVIQGYEEFIDSQSVLITQQAKAVDQSILQGRILTDSIVIADNSDEESESLGIPYLNVKKYDLGPVEIDLPHAARDIKSLFEKVRDLFKR